MRVEMEENNSCLQYFELLFTNDVYQLILNETIRFERQKRHLEHNLREHLYDLTIPELKALAWSHFKYGFNKKKQC